ELLLNGQANPFRVAGGGRIVPKLQKMEWDRENPRGDFNLSLPVPLGVAGQTHRPPRCPDGLHDRDVAFSAPGHGHLETSNYRISTLLFHGCATPAAPLFIGKSNSP